jgi:hypothetical protein
MAQTLSDQSATGGTQSLTPAERETRLWAALMALQEVQSVLGAHDGTDDFRLKTAHSAIEGAKVLVRSIWSDACTEASK